MGVTRDGDFVLLEEDIAIRISEFSQGEEGVVAKFGEDVAGSGLGWKFGEDIKNLGVGRSDGFVVGESAGEGSSRLWLAAGAIWE